MTDRVMVKQFETIILQVGLFHLLGKKVLRQRASSYGVVLVDATLCPCDRPTKQHHYSVKKKRHT